MAQPKFMLAQCIRADDPTWPELILPSTGRLRNPASDEREASLFWPPWVEGAPVDLADAPGLKLGGARPMCAKRSEETWANCVRARRLARETARLRQREAARRSGIGIQQNDGELAKAIGSGLSVTILLESATSLAFTTYVRSAPIPAGAVHAALKGSRQKAGVSPKLALPTLVRHGGSGARRSLAAPALVLSKRR